MEPYKCRSLRSGRNTNTFDGANLNLSVDYNSVINVPATFGKSKFQPSDFVSMVNTRPLPEGNYSFSVNSIQTPQLRDTVLAPFHIGRWPFWGTGPSVPWGDVRAPLTASTGTDTFRRVGFSFMEECFLNLRVA